MIGRFQLLVSLHVLVSIASLAGVFGHANVRLRTGARVARCEWHKRFLVHDKTDAWRCLFLAFDEEERFAVRRAQSVRLELRTSY